MTTLDDIAARHTEPHSCLGIDPIMGPGRRVFGVWSAHPEFPREPVECDTAVLLGLVREAREALQTISDADGEGRARFIAPLLARLTEGSDRT